MTETYPQPAVHKPNGGRLLKPRKPEYDYHWGRILGVLLLVLVLGAVSAYGIYRWFYVPSLPAVDEIEKSTAPSVMPDVSNQIEKSNEPSIMPDASWQSEQLIETEQSEMAEVLHQSEQPDEIAIALSDQQVTLEGEDLMQPDTVSNHEVTREEIQPEEVKPLLDETIIHNADPPFQAVNEPPIQSEPTVNEIDQSSVEEAAGLEVTEDPLAEPEYWVDSKPATTPMEGQLHEADPMPMEEAPLDSQPEFPAEVPVEDIQETSLPSVEQVPEMALVGGIFQLQELQILQPEVKRFQLAKAISDKEPLGEIQEIQLNEDGSAKVWAFSDVADMRGQQLNYVWLHEGSEVARVPVRVGGIRWRSYSSKTINIEMKGSWRVELQNGDGSLLASADFVLP